MADTFIFPTEWEGQFEFKLVPGYVYNPELRRRKIHASTSAASININHPAHGGDGGSLELIPVKVEGEIGVVTFTYETFRQNQGWNLYWALESAKGSSHLCVPYRGKFYTLWNARAERDMMRQTVRFFGDAEEYIPPPEPEKPRALIASRRTLDL